jgi:hypothetical protein
MDGTWKKSILADCPISCHLFQDKNVRKILLDDKNLTGLIGWQALISRSSGRALAAIGLHFS